MTKQTPAGRQQAGGLAAYDGTNWNAYLTFLKMNFATQPGSGFHRTQLVRDCTGGYDLKKIESETPTEVTALLQEQAADGFTRLHPSLCQSALRFEPGSRWEYSNYGFILLVAVIEKFSGQSYSDYVREHVFNPAGMTSTSLGMDDKAIPNLRIEYTKMGATHWIPKSRFDPETELSSRPKRSEVEGPAVCFPSPSQFSRSQWIFKWA